MLGWALQFSGYYYMSCRNWESTHTAIYKTKINGVSLLFFYLTDDVVLSVGNYCVVVLLCDTAAVAFI